MENNIIDESMEELFVKINDGKENELAECDEKIKKAMEEKVDKITGLIFKDILRFEEDKLEKVADVINTSLDLMKFETNLPTKELQDIVDNFFKICEWWERKKDNPDWMLTINPNDVLRAKSRIGDLKNKLTRAVAYYRTLSSGGTLNRRATRAATSIAIRQFSADMDTNIRKLLTVADSENFGELLASKVHMGVLTIEYINNFLSEVNGNMKSTMEDMKQVVDQIKFDMKMGGLV